MLVIKLRTGNPSYTRMGGKYDAKTQSNVSSILKQVNFIDATRIQGRYSHLGWLLISGSRVIVVAYGEEWWEGKRREVAHNRYAIGCPGVNGRRVGRCSKNIGRPCKTGCPCAKQGGEAMQFPETHAVRGRRKLRMCWAWRWTWRSQGRDQTPRRGCHDGLGVQPKCQEVGYCTQERSGKCTLQMV